jgi:FMN phosphatase YigB (HAD superfamily)
MSKTLLEYIDWLHGRDDLIWPRVSAPQPVRAKPTLKPLPDIKGVLWSVYGTLLTIQDGELLHEHPEDLRMQVAMEKTIEQFHMWYSMHREKGAPWEGMLRQYRKIVQQLAMVGTKRKGDRPHVDSARTWHTIIDRLIANEYQWEESLASNADDLAVKVAYFFHAMLQGVRAAPHVADVLVRLSQSHLRQGLLADTQRFTFAQLVHALGGTDRLPNSNELFSPTLLIESHRFGIRKPSETLFARAAHRVEKLSLDPEQVLYVSHRLEGDLAIASEFGFRTALYAGDRKCCPVTPEQLKDPDLRPDRLITDLQHVMDLVAV